MKLQGLLLSLFIFSLASPVLGQDDADFSNLANDDASEMLDLEQADGGMTDSDLPLGVADMMDPSSIAPTAYGVTYSNGAKQSGTPNWTSLYNNTHKRYEISINGEQYYYLNYATTITPAGDNRYCKSSSVSGKLLVYCYDKQGNLATSRFGFVTFKAP